jgi:manganese efflux pump family protein
MGFAQIFLLAVGLAMDATAAAATRGSAAQGYRAKELLKVALLFGGAQAIMPLAGAGVGERFGPYVAAFDHWIAFFVLGAIGAKMLHESWSQHTSPKDASGFGWRVLLGLALATSIDAFAVGLTLPMLNAPLVLSVVTIGLVTALLSGVGVAVGHRFGALLGPRLDAFGGVVLILLGLKILVEHLTAPWP